MSVKYVSAEAVADAVLSVKIGEEWSVDLTEVSCAIANIPAAEVVSRADYDKLLRAARKMHEWIFLNSYDEVEAFKECGLSEEMNAMLGSLGRMTAVLDKETDDV